MKPQIPRFAFVRGSAAAAIGLVGLLAACEAKVPTESDIKQMDASSAEHAARQFAVVGARDSVKYIIDGTAASERAAKGLKADEIEKLDVVKSDNGVATIALTTTTADGKPRTNTLGRPGSDSVVNGWALILKSQAATGTTPIFIVDGVRTDQASFAKLDRDHIAAVEVLKGKAAQTTYGPDAEHGVIVVTTKK